VRPGRPLPAVVEPPPPAAALPSPLWEAQPAAAAAAGASLRGVRAVSARVAWASGSAGTVLRTTDGGCHVAAPRAPG
jgi:photosystem II stability/assembly factor-like uncharacterized protein